MTRSKRRRPVVPHPKMAQWQVAAWTRRVDAFLDAQDRRQGFNRRAYVALLREMDSAR